MVLKGNLLKLQEAILDGDEVLAGELTKVALVEDNKPEYILKEVLAPALQKLGQLWKEGKLYMPNAVVSIDSFQAAKDVLMAHEGYRMQYIGKVVIGTVAGNEHILGKKMIIGMLEASGFEVINLGENVPAHTFIDTIREEKPDVLGLGCYTSSAVYSLQMLVKLIQEGGLRDSVRIIIGGEATSQELADELGADSWGGDVVDTVKKVKKLINVV